MSGPGLAGEAAKAKAEGLSIRQTQRRLGVSYHAARRLWHEAPAPEPAPDIAELVERAVEARLARMGGYAKPPDQGPPPPPLPPPGRSHVVRDETRAERTLFLSDLHCPFHDMAAWRAVIAFVRDFRPQLVLLAGDLFDCYSISSHDQDPGRADCIQDEFDAAQPLWAELDDACKDATVVYWKGNHEERIDRMQREKRGLFRLRSLELPVAAEMPKRWAYYPNQTRYKLGALSCLHGDLKGRGTASMHAAAGMLRKLRTTCLFGHLHRFQTFYETNADGTVRAGFASGHLCDVEQAKYISNPDWQQGVSTIDYDWSADLFSVRQHLIVNGRLRWGGQSYPAG